MINVFIGYDPRWPSAYAVAARSLQQMASLRIRVQPLLLPHMQAVGYYDRPTTLIEGQLHDEISNAPMATEFAISRFFAPMLCDYKGFSLFCDSDFLFRADIRVLISDIDYTKAVSCVKHNYNPVEDTKMNGQAQTKYARKNWSSLMVFNNEHLKNRALNWRTLNSIPGRDLHRFAWLNDDDIGEIDARWNWLEGHHDPSMNPLAVHFTRGTPDMPGYENAPFADEWRDVLKKTNLTRE